MVKWSALGDTMHTWRINNIALNSIQWKDKAKGKTVAQTVNILGTHQLSPVRNPSSTTAICPWESFRWAKPESHQSHQYKGQTQLLSCCVVMATMSRH